MFFQKSINGHSWIDFGV